MKVKIIKAKSPNYWYAKSVGREFNVELNTTFDNYEVTEGSFTKCVINKYDCEVVEEFQNGDIVEVADIKNNWYKRIFIGMNPHTETAYKYITTGRNVQDLSSWKYCRKSSKAVEPTTIYATITGATSTIAWYYTEINNKFEVEELNTHQWKVISNGRIIQKVDCTITEH